VHSTIIRSARGLNPQAGNGGFIKLVADADRGVLVGRPRRPSRRGGAGRACRRGARRGTNRPAPTHDLRSSHVPPRSRTGQGRWTTGDAQARSCPDQQTGTRPYRCARLRAATVRMLPGVQDEYARRLRHKRRRCACPTASQPPRSPAARPAQPPGVRSDAPAGPAPPDDVG
jgi:hypothetical protein